MALFGFDAITKIIDGIKNGIPLWGSTLGNKGEKPAPDSEGHDDYNEEYSGDESWSREPHDGYHDDYDDDYEEYDPAGEYYHEEYDADDGSYTVTEFGRRGAYDDDDNYSFVMFTEHDDDDY